MLMRNQIMHFLPGFVKGSMHANIVGRFLRGALNTTVPAEKTVKLQEAGRG